MAATVLPVAQIIENGIAVPAGTAADIVNGNSPATNNGVTTFIRMVNTVASAATVNLPYVLTVDGKSLPNDTWALAATVGAVMYAGPFPIMLFGKSPVFTASAVTVLFDFFQI